MKFDKPIQDYYPENTAICYGCGRMNPDGLHIKTHWDGASGLCEFSPWPQHTAFPGFVYGGLLASLIDCHSIGTAIAAMYDAAGRTPDDGGEEITCVTGRLDVRYLKPTPHGVPLRLVATVTEMSEKKALVACSVYVHDEETVRGETVAVRVPSRMIQGGHQLKAE